MAAMLVGMAVGEGGGGGAQPVAPRMVGATIIWNWLLSHFKIVW
jgi:hypothetical protein